MPRCNTRCICRCVLLQNGKCPACFMNPADCICINMEKSQRIEMEYAKMQGRIPKCVSCSHELEKISIEQKERISWEWDADKKEYVKDNSGSSEKPYHDCQECSCEYQDWDFLDENSQIDIGVKF